MSEAELWSEAERWIAGCGNAAAGEWRENRPRAKHVRRRLTGIEQWGAGIAALADVRGTPEHEQRIARVRPFLPASMRYLPTADLG